MVGAGRVWYCAFVGPGGFGGARGGHAGPGSLAGVAAAYSCCAGLKGEGGLSELSPTTKAKTSCAPRRGSDVATVDFDSGRPAAGFDPPRHCLMRVVSMTSLPRHYLLN